MAKCLIGLGSNLGDRQRYINSALRLLDEQQDVWLVACSRFYETASVGGPVGQEKFLNAAAVVETALDAESLLDAIITIEEALGRQRNVRWDARTIDVDLLLFNEQTIRSSRLTVPHPRMAFRKFVLAPAAEVAAEMRDPATGKTIGELWYHMNSAHDYVAIGVTHPRAIHVAAALARDVVARLETDIQLPAQLLSTVGAFQAISAADDSTGRKSEAAIEFVTLFVENLDEEKWQNYDAWIVSDFWFDQVLGFVSDSCESRQNTELQELWKTALKDIVLPKLVVVVDDGDEESGKVGRAVAGLAAAAKQTDLPTLWLTSHERASWVDEVTAAILAMQEEPRPLDENEQAADAD